MSSEQQSLLEIGVNSSEISFCIIVKFDESTIANENDRTSVNFRDRNFGYFKKVRGAERPDLLANFFKPF